MHPRPKRTLGFLGFALLVLLATGAGSARADLLIYDENTTNQRALDAAMMLGQPFTRGMSGNFNTLLTTGTWDVVVVDCPSMIPAGGWVPLINYINGGGRVIMSFWDLDNDFGQGNPLLPGAFQVSVTSSVDPTPQPVFRLDPSHPIFNMPNTVGDLTSFTNQWGDDGDRLALVPMSGAIAVAGFTPTPMAGQAAIVIGNNGRTIYNGFLFDEVNDPEGTNLIANQITFILQGSGGGGVVPEPGTLALFGLGVCGLLAYGWRRRRAA